LEPKQVVGIKEHLNSNTDVDKITVIQQVELRFDGGIINVSMNHKQRHERDVEDGEVIWMSEDQPLAQGYGHHTQCEGKFVQHFYLWLLLHKITDAFVGITGNNFSPIFTDLRKIIE